MAKTIIAPIVIVATMIAGGAYWYAVQTQPINTACTMETKLCPDGSSVGRTGPDCAFAPCPDGTLATNTDGTLSDAGIRGTIMLGPTCPVEHMPPDPNCADKPYQTLVSIFRASDPTHPFLLIMSNVSGTFSVSVPPGQYTLSAGESRLPSCDHPSITVLPHAFSSVTISCDTGIR
ncbi:MAG: hypothetical protein WC246_00805 [Candidatus Paceibacterota bacterium]|jgi:hypothetical protein